MPENTCLRPTVGDLSQANTAFCVHTRASSEACTPCWKPKFHLISLFLQTFSAGALGASTYHSAFPYKKKKSAPANCMSNSICAAGKRAQCIKRVAADENLTKPHHCTRCWEKDSALHARLARPEGTCKFILPCVTHCSWQPLPPGVQSLIHKIRLKWAAALFNFVNNRTKQTPIFSNSSTCKELMTFGWYLHSIKGAHDDWNKVCGDKGLGWSSRGWFLQKKIKKKIKNSKKKNALNSELCASPGSLANWKASNSPTCSSSQNTHRLAAVMQQLVQRNQLGTNTKTSTLT